MIRIAILRTFLAVFVLACGIACTTVPPDPRPSADPPSPTAPVPFSFEDTASLLAPREILLTPLLDPRADDLVPPRVFHRRLRTRMLRHAGWRVLSVHPAIVDMPNPHFMRFDMPMYVVEITGPETGNCFDFYDAETGGYEGSACFYPPRG